MDKIGDLKLNQIHTGDARLLGESIPDESINLVFCDPVYDRVEDYGWVAQLAKRVLVPGGNLIAQSGHYYVNRIYPLMNDSGLDYVWTIAEKGFGQHAAIYKHKILACWKPFLWYSKGRRNGGWVMDWIKGGGRTKSNHAWEDSPLMFINLIDRLTNEGDIVFDPFTGSATVPAVCKMLNRNYIAFEIDPATAELARNRVANTQPPLPFAIAKQGVLL